MRDIERIQPLLTEFGKIWKKYFPDMRFMQAIDNFQSWLGNDGFYIEDDELIERFREFAELKEAVNLAKTRLMRS